MLLKKKKKVACLKFKSVLVKKKKKKCLTQVFLVWGYLIFKGGYEADACIWTYKINPTEIFPLTKKRTLNKYFWLFWPSTANSYTILVSLVQNKQKSQRPYLFIQVQIRFPNICFQIGN